MTRVINKFHSIHMCNYCDIRSVQLPIMSQWPLVVMQLNSYMVGRGLSPQSPTTKDTSIKLDVFIELYNEKVNLLICVSVKQVIYSHFISFSATYLVLVPKPAERHNLSCGSLFSPGVSSWMDMLKSPPQGDVQETSSPDVQTTSTGSSQCGGAAALL